MTQLRFQETDENFILMLRINSLKVLVESSISTAGLWNTEGRNGKKSASG